MRRISVALFLVLVLAASLMGCKAAVPKDQAAIFQNYESVQTQAAVGGSPVGAMLNGTKYVPAKYKSTGNAIVAVADMKVAAKCPIQGLEEGAKVLVRQNVDGTWVVVGKQ